MERMKLVVLVVIAIALVKLAFGGWVGEAHAEAGAITCEAFYADQIGNMRQEKSLEASKVYMGTVQAWLASHPGDPVFRTTLVNQIGANAFGYIDIVCLRG
jgi:hypothetical protein